MTTLKWHWGRPQRDSGSGDVVRKVKNYVEVSVAERKVDRLQFSSRTFNRSCDVGTAPRTTFACKALSAIRSVTPFNEIFWHDKTLAKQLDALTHSIRVQIGAAGRRGNRAAWPVIRLSKMQVVKDAGWQRCRLSKMIVFIDGLCGVDLNQCF